MTLDFICDGGTSVGFIAESDSLRRQVKSTEYDTLLTICCIFQLPVWLGFIVLIVVHIILDDLLESDDEFFGKFDFHQCGDYSLFYNILKCQTGTNVFQEADTSLHGRQKPC